jgi:hypothetical protein
MAFIVQNAQELISVYVVGAEVSTNLQEFATLRDDILAYEFQYPVTLSGMRLSVIPSRKPERYSSAAPLSADARQRIVCELVDFPERMTITVTVMLWSSWHVVRHQSSCKWTQHPRAAVQLLESSEWVSDRWGHPLGFSKQSR